MRGNESGIIRGYRNEILKVILLNNLVRSDEYPYALLKALQKKKIWFLQNVTKNDVYNALSSMEKQGYIKSKIKTEGSSVRKNYKVTPEGKKIVKTARMAMLDSFRDVAKMIKE